MRATHEVGHALYVQVASHLHPFTFHRILLFRRRRCTQIKRKGRHEPRVEEALRDIDFGDYGTQRSVAAL